MNDRGILYFLLMSILSVLFFLKILEITTGGVGFIFLVADMSCLTYLPF